MIIMSAQIRRLALLSASLAGVVLLAACSSSSNSTPASTPAPSNAGSSAGGGSAAADVNACALVTPARVSSLVGITLDSATPTTIAAGQDQCAYSSSTGNSLTVIVYQPDSGVSWTVLTGGSGADTSVSGVGDHAATDRAVEIDVQTGNYLVAVQSGSDTGRVAVAKAVVAALH
jgi:hypothetical protein